MRMPLEIHFHNLEKSPAVEDAIRKRAAKLEEFADDIMSCRVTVDGPHKHYRQGNLFAVSVDLRLVGREVMANRDTGTNHAHEDVYVAIHDAFDAVRRQLQDHVRVRRGDTKHHAP